MTDTKPIRRIAIVGTGVIGAVQLAPITPVPMMAMRRLGLVSVISFLRCVC